jgi:hypothetical protein
MHATSECHARRVKIIAGGVVLALRGLGKPG